MKIELYNNYQKEINFDFEKIIKDVETLDSNAEIALILVDIDEIHKINKEYRHKDYPTDVISFESDDEEDENYRGEIFLCVDKVYEQAKLYEHSNEREFAFLLVHGVLHLHGYDHMTEEDEKVMFAKQDEILNKLNYKR
ncbi:MAG: rRNA maturation RNase YbeY [Coprobacillus sp.]|nr:rRNA maturation RNase YbeY [Coprobacillus sp.]MDY4145251.1 rRNA maturation RNase YbeY [Bacilli bacterium]CCY07219.1 probable rRNA maturation factor [Coprobacillus sp. CAG:698]